MPGLSRGASLFSGASLNIYRVCTLSQVPHTLGTGDIIERKHSIPVLTGLIFIPEGKASKQQIIKQQQQQQTTNNNSAALDGVFDSSLSDQRNCPAQSGVLFQQFSLWDKA